MKIFRGASLLSLSFALLLTVFLPSLGAAQIAPHAISAPPLDTSCLSPYEDGVSLLPGKILFISDRDGDFEIFTMKTDGTGVVQLTFNTSKDSMARWSPDGSKIAFVRNDSKIYMMDSNGKNEQYICDGKTVAFSPDGKKLAFTKYG
ncbi:MAG: TolB family protein, partial [Acidobacteriota bacterium]